MPRRSDRRKTASAKYVPEPGSESYPKKFNDAQDALDRIEKEGASCGDSVSGSSSTKMAKPRKKRRTDKSKLPSPIKVLVKEGKIPLPAVNSQSESDEAPEFDQASSLHEVPTSSAGGGDDQTHEDGSEDDNDADEEVQQVQKPLLKGVKKSVKADITIKTEKSAPSEFTNPKFHCYVRFICCI